MVKYLNVKDPLEDQLPADLAYHCALLKVFAGCTIGRVNMNSVEAMEFVKDRVEGSLNNEEFLASMNG